MNYKYFVFGIVRMVVLRRLRTPLFMQFKTPRKNLLEKKIIECLLKLYLLKIYL